MDSTTNNGTPKKREKDVSNTVDDTPDLESNDAVPIGGSVIFGSDLMKQVFSLNPDFGRIKHEDKITTSELEFEKDLKQAKNKYYSDLLEFSEITQSHNVMMKRKNELKNELYNSIDKILGGLKVQIDSCKELPALTSSICENLSTIEEAESVHYRECVDLFAAFANRCIEVYGYESGEVEKVNTSGYRNTVEIATDCLRVFKFLKEKGPYDPFDEKITETQKMNAELDVHFNNLQSATKGLENEEEKLDKELEILREKIWMAEQEKVAAKEKAKAEEEAKEETLVALIHSNMKRQTEYVAMGKKIEFIQEKLKERPESEQKLEELRARIGEKNESLMLLQNANERTKAAISSMNFNIEDLKKQTDLMEKNHDKEIQEMQSKVNSMEIENRDKQAALKVSTENRDKVKEECERNQERLKKIEDEFKASKEEVRLKKAEKKKNLREKRKLKEQLVREKMRLSFTLGMQQV